MVDIAFRRERVSWAFGKEASYGTQLTPLKRMFGDMISSSPADTVTMHRLRTLGVTAQRELVFQRTGRFVFSGSDAAWWVNPQILRFAFSKYVFTGGSPNVHEFQNDDTALPSFSLGILNDETVPFNRTYIGCKVNTLTIEATTDNPVKAAVEWLASRAVATGVSGIVSGTPSTVTPQNISGISPYIFQQGAITKSGGTPESPYTRVTSFTYSLRNNLVPYWTIQSGGQFANYISEAGLDHELRMNVVVASRNDWEDLVEESLLDFAATFTRSLAPEDSLKFDFQDIRWESAPIHVPESGPIFADIVGTPQRVIATAKNGDDTYESEPS